MNTYIALLCLLFGLFQADVYAFEQFYSDHDRLMYYPQIYGLKKLECDVSVPGIGDKLPNKLKRVDAKLTWTEASGVSLTFPNEYKNYLELKNALTKLITLRSDYLVPQKLSQYLAGHEIRKNGKLFVAIDKKQTSKYSEISFYLNQLGLVKKSVAKSAIGSYISEFQYAKDKRSRNQFILSSVKTKKYFGHYHSELRSKVEYQQVGEYYLAKRIVSHQTEKGMSDSDEKKITNSEILFSNCKAETNR